jgi:hypothetical protein
MFLFEVKKANEQEEGVRLREGFSVRSFIPRTLIFIDLTNFHQFKSPYIVNHLAPEGVKLDERHLQARLVVGECRQGIMTVEYMPGTNVTKRTTEVFSTLRLKSFL